MTSRIFVVFLVTTLVAFAGCSTLSGGGGESEVAAFESSVEEISPAVVDDAHNITIAVENVGEAAGETDVWYEVGGENYTETVTLDEGESTTVTFTHAFDEAGNHDVNVSGDSATVAAADTPLDAAELAMDNVSTMVVEGEMEMTVDVTLDGVEVNDADVGATFEATYDFEAEEMHRRSTADVGSGVVSLGTEVEEWYVGETVYGTADGELGLVGEEDEVYRVSGVGFDEAREISTDEVLRLVNDAERETTADAYVYTVSAEDAAAMEMLDTVTDDRLVDIGMDDAIEAPNIVVTIDRDTHYLTHIEMKMEVDGEVLGEEVDGDGIYTIKFTDFNEDVDITVPKDIRNATANDE